MHSSNTPLVKRNSENRSYWLDRQLSKMEDANKNFNARMGELDTLSNVIDRRAGYASIEDNRRRPIYGDYYNTGPDYYNYENPGEAQYLFTGQGAYKRQRVVNRHNRTIRGKPYSPFIGRPNTKSAWYEAYMAERMATRKQKREERKKHKKDALQM
jgi:hypothetical protein